MTEESPKKLNWTPGQERFLKRWAAAPFLSIKGTAKAVGIVAETAYQWRLDPAFIAECDRQRAATQDDLAREAVDYLKAQIPAVMREKIRLAKAANREDVRDAAGTWLLEYVLGKGAGGTTRTEVTGPDGGPIAVETGLSDVDTEQLVSLAREIFDPGGSRPGDSPGAGAEARAPVHTDLETA